MMSSSSIQPDNVSGLRDSDAVPDDAILLENNVKITKADTSLQQKAGIGDVDSRLVKDAERIIDRNMEDFVPLAEVFLKRLLDAIEKARDGVGTRENRLDAITHPVMDLKATARMFKYTLVTNLANIMLGFLESIDDPDMDVIDIVEAHYKTLRLIVSKRMYGDGGRAGQTLQKELEDVCKRYKYVRASRP